MTVSIKLLASMLMILGATCCSESRRNLPGGYYLIDGGGSKLSLARRDGAIIINYVVTGLIETKKTTVVQYLVSGNHCSYIELQKLPLDSTNYLIGKPKTIRVGREGKIVGLTKLTSRACEKFERFK